jgi:WD40 repeat protein
VPVAAGTALLLAILGGLAVSTVLYFQAREAADEARRQGYVASLEAAASHLSGGAGHLARKRLGACPEELRDWEWRHLSLRADGSLAALESGGPVVFTAYSPDGSRIHWVSAEDFQLRETAYRHYRTRVIRGSIAGALPAYVAAVHPSSGRVAVLHWLGKGASLRADSNIESIFFPYTLSAHSSSDSPSSDEHKGVLEVLSAPSGPSLGRLEIVAAGEATKILRQDPALTNLAFGRRNREQLMVVLDGSFKPVLRVSWPRVIQASFSWSGQRIAAWGWDGVIRVWDLGTGRISELRDGHSDGINAVLFSPDDEKLLSSSFDGSIRIWDLPTGRSLVRSVAEPVRSLALAPDGEVIACGTENGTVHLWDWSGRLIGSRTSLGESEIKCRPSNIAFRTSPCAVRALAFDPDGDVLAVARGETVEIFSHNLGSQLGALLGHDSPVLSLAFSPDGKQLASGDSGETLRLWDPTMRGGIMARKITDHWVTSVDVDPGGRYLAVADSSELASASYAERFFESLKIWDLNLHTALETTLGAGGGRQVVRFSPQGDEIAGGFFDGKIRLWSASSGRLLRELEDSDAE